MEFNKAYLESLISGEIDEDSRLEYKAADALKKEDGKKKEITKDVSAFANAGGGVIVYGMAEHREGNDAARPTGIDPVDAKIIPKEWLDQVISSIQPKIVDLKIHPVQVGAKKNEMCYIVEVPQSDTAHQAKDGRYYKRRNFESTMMEDYEIRDVMNRRKHPKLDAEVRIVERGVLLERSLVIRIRNASRVMARHYAVKVKFPTNLDGYFTFFEKERIDHLEGKYAWSLITPTVFSRPLFPDSEVVNTLDFNCSTITDQNVVRNSIKEIQLLVYADEMECIRLNKDPIAAMKSWV